MDIITLAAELTADPLARGYAGMTHQQAADSLNTKNRDYALTNMTGDELFANTDSVEFAALTDAKKSQWISFCSTDRHPFGAANVAFVQYIFGGGSTTVSNLSAARTLENHISRAEELGLGTVSAGHVEAARA